MSLISGSSFGLIFDTELDGRGKEEEEEEEVREDGDCKVCLLTEGMGETEPISEEDLALVCVLRVFVLV